MKKFFYRVQKEDNIFSLSSRFNVPTGKLIHDNNLKANVLAGDILYIESEQSELYEVQVIDTLESIANKFNVAPEEILQKNYLPYIFCAVLIKV